MTTLSDYARLYGSMLPDIPDAGLGPATNATRAGHQNAFLSAGQNQSRPADYLQPVAEALSIPLGAYGAGQMIGEGYQTAREANSLMDFGQGVGLAAIGALGIMPGRSGKKNQLVPEAPHKALGYSDNVFYRGEASGKLPDEYHSAFFSRDKEYADGFAKRGGQDAPREFRLNLENSFSDGSPVNATTYVRLAESVARDNPKAAAEMIDMIAPGKDLEWAKKFAEYNPDFDVADSGALVRQMVESNASSWQNAFMNAGFDAIDTGRDVYKLSGDGIRHVDAKFDPANAASRNIFASLGGLGLLGLSNYTDDGAVK